MGFVLGLLALLAEPVRAVPILTLDNPNPTIALPSSPINYAFTGTLKLDPGFSFESATLLFAFQGGAVPGLVGTFVNDPYTGADSGGFVGSLFTLQISPSSALGFYDQQFGGGPAQFSITGIDANLDTETVTANYTVTLVSAVPTPSSVVLAACSFVMIVGFNRLRRRSP